MLLFGWTEAFSSNGSHGMVLKRSMCRFPYLGPKRDPTTCMIFVIRGPEKGPLRGSLKALVSTAETSAARRDRLRRWGLRQLLRRIVPTQSLWARGLLNGLGEVLRILLKRASKFASGLFVKTLWRVLHDEGHEMRGAKATQQVPACGAILVLFRWAKQRPSSEVGEAEC